MTLDTKAIREFAGQFSADGLNASPASVTKLARAILSLLDERERVARPAFAFADFVAEIDDVVREARGTNAVDAKGRNIALYFGDMLRRIEDAIDIVNQRVAFRFAPAANRVAPKDDELLKAVEQAESDAANAPPTGYAADFNRRTREPIIVAGVRLLWARLARVEKEAERVARVHAGHVEYGSAEHQEMYTPLAVRLMGERDAAVAERDALRARAADVDDAKRIWADDVLRKVRRLSDGTDYEVGTLVVMTDEELHKRHGLAHAYDDRVHVITSTLGRESHLVECGPRQIGSRYLKRAPEGAAITCSACAGWDEQMRKSRADAEAFRKTQEVTHERDEARRLLAAEQEQCQRLGADNLRRMQRLGVKYPEGLDSGIDRLERERDAALSTIADMRSAGDETSTIERLQRKLADATTELTEIRKRVPDLAAERAMEKERAVVEAAEAWLDAPDRHPDEHVEDAYAEAAGKLGEVIRAMRAGKESANGE